MPDLRLDDKVVALDHALGRARMPHAIGGAIALAFYAVPRATIDIDINLFVRADQARTVLDALRPLGVEVDGALPAIEHAGQCRVYWGQTPVDLFFSGMAFHEAMARAVRRVSFGPDVLPILAPEHLMVCKALFDRAKDWLDIEQMLVSVPALRVTEVMRWMDGIAGADDARVIRLRTLVARMRGPA
jgi:hypothetical protein